MNRLDKIVSYVSPKTGAKRMAARYKTEAAERLLNSGYSHGGASKTKRSMQGWDSKSASPQDDIDVNLHLLRQRARDLAMNTPIGAAAISRNAINVVGSGLKLRCQIDHNALGITEQQAIEWKNHTEQEFALWAEQKNDHTGLNTFYDAQVIMLTGWLMNGDSLALAEYAEPDPNQPYQLRLHLIEADRLCTPGAYMGASQIVELPDGGRIANGIETDKAGRVVAYHIANRYLNTALSAKPLDWVRVEARNRANGMPNVIYVVKQDRAEQYRGVPLLAPVIEQIKQMSRYTEAEITAAIINSFFTAFVESDAPVNDFALGSPVAAQQQVDIDDEEMAYELGPGTINQLRPGEKISLADPKHPNSGFEAFSTAMAKLIGAAIDVPYEVLLTSFNSSYSASRAALLQAWQGFKTKREWFAADFCQPVYEMWLYEAVAAGRVKAPGFFDDPLKRKLWSGAAWIGPSAGQVDPVKEITAAQLRIASGFSTGEREAYEINGSDFHKNIDALRREQAELKEIFGDKGAEA